MFRTIALGCAVALAWSCSRPDDGAGGGPQSGRPVARPSTTDAGAAPRPGADLLRAQLHPTTGAPVSGMVTFTERDGAVEVSVQVNGLAPYARHGLHLHTGNQCGRTGDLVGPHFDPAGRPHAGPDATAQHAGDLGNLEADEEGHATLQRTWPHVSLRSGPTAVLGHTVAVSSRPDDETTQPDGKSGKTIACGVIQ